MTTATVTSRLRASTRKGWATDPWLAFVAGATLFAFVATLVGMAVDHRAITGAPVWLKPAKFAISISVYSATLVWMLGFVQRRRRWALVATRATALMLAGELLIIAVQAARGTTSHFNDSAPINLALFSAMGVMITVVWSANLLATVLLLRERGLDAPLAWSLRLGLALSLVGMLAAFPMLMHGSHTIGAPDGGPGMPLTGWSTVGGDPRIAHFIGLHAMQILPLLGWALSRRSALSVGHRLALLVVAALGYLGAILLLTWQALRAQPLLSPDGLTLAVAAGLVGAIVLAALAVVAEARRPRRVVSRLVGAE